MAEGGGLLNRYTLSRRIEGSNPSVSAKNLIRDIATADSGAFLIRQAEKIVEPGSSLWVSAASSTLKNCAFD